MMNGTNEIRPPICPSFWQYGLCCSGKDKGSRSGVGTGRFAVEKTGVDPARSMLDRAEERGVEVIQGVAEALPLECSSFDYTRLRGP